jgi:hypothetical protein
MNLRVIPLVIGLWGIAGGALAQDPPPAPSLEIGVRYWLSTGSTQRGHNASENDPTIIDFGNPTSTLIYDGLDAHSVELYARKPLGEVWFVKGLVGLGRVTTGTFTDQDFISVFGTQLMFLETITKTDGKLQYGMLDFGADVWKRGNDTIGVFVGYHQWTEELEGHGGSTTVDLFDFDTNLPPSVIVIRNKLTWKAGRAGMVYRGLNGRTRVNAELAYVPYAKYRNEDSHLLRENTFGPSPNIIATGRGVGYQLELEVRRSFPQLWDLDIGLAYRYWNLKAKRGSQTQAGETFPIVELVSERQGVMFSVTKSW